MNPVRLTRQQVRSVDCIAVEKYAMPGIVLMENAARGVADVATNILRAGDRVLILSGPGNNGGDGLAAARHLHNRGFDIQILFLADPAKYKGDAKVNFDIVQLMHLPTALLTVESISNAALLVDALFGTGLTDAPRPPFERIVAAIDASKIPVLAIDIPSGLDCDTGKPLGPAAIRATHTVTFVAEKIGFANPSATPYLGHIIVADIGCPRECIAEAMQMTSDK